MLKARAALSPQSMTLKGFRVSAFQGLGLSARDFARSFFSPQDPDALVLNRPPLVRWSGLKGFGLKFRGLRFLFVSAGYKAFRSACRPG